MECKKKLVHDFWNAASCGEQLYLKNDEKESFLDHSYQRYKLEPMIEKFAEFSLYDQKKVLEIGVGLGADHQRFAESGAILHGIDLTERAISHTKKRLNLFGLQSDLRIADAETLPYSDDSFHLVYSWGVLHHSPNTSKAISEAFRVLKKGGEAKIMVYHKYSLVGYMLWIRYALFAFKPFISLSRIYNEYVESPGTKAYSRKEAKKLFCEFETVEIKTVLTHGDLLTSSAGQRHRGPILAIAKIIWPRTFLKTFFKSHGLAMLIHARK